jgi:hypothetical protein
MIRLTLIAAALVLQPLALAGQSEVDSRWLPFIGCWEVLGAEGTPLVCVEPNPNNPASVILQGDGPNASMADTLYMDGVPRPVAPTGCSGTERTYLSEDERRFFTRGEYTCSDGTPQTGSGILAMIASDEWLDVRTLSDGVDEVVLVQRYVRATPSAVEAASRRELAAAESQLARARASRAPGVDELIEAYEQAGARATNAWILEAGYDLRVTAGDLIALADAGVDESVIDAAVALSHPEEFAITLPQPGMPTQVARADNSLSDEELMARRANRVWYQPWGWRGAFSPWGWSPWGGFGFDPFFFGGGGWGGWGGGFFGPWGGGFLGPWGGNGIIVAPGVPGGAPGQAVAGRGYVNRGTAAGTASRRGVQPAGVAAPSASQRSGIATPRGVQRRGTISAPDIRRRGTAAPPSRGTRRPAASARPGSSGSRGAVTRSGGSAGRSTGRTARPRRGGGLL